MSKELHGRAKFRYEDKELRMLCIVLQKDKPWAEIHWSDGSSEVIPLSAFSLEVSRRISEIFPNLSLYSSFSDTFAPKITSQRLITYLYLRDIMDSFEIFKHLPDSQKKIFLIDVWSGYPFLLLESRQNKFDKVSTISTVAIESSGAPLTGQMLQLSVAEALLLQLRELSGPKGDAIKTVLDPLGDTTTEFLAQRLRFIGDDDSIGIAVLSDRGARQEATRCDWSSCMPVAPCAKACIEGVNIPGFIRELRQGQRDKAKDIILSSSSTNSGPDCTCLDQPPPCEAACALRAKGLPPVAIRELIGYALGWKKITAMIE